MKFYVEEITVLKDGTSPIAITEKPSENEARASFHQAMASAIINPNVASIHVEAKNSVGGIYESGTWVAPIETPIEEPVETEPIDENVPVTKE